MAKILLPELDNPEVQKFRDLSDASELNLDLMFDNIDLQHSMEMLKHGVVDGLVVGASHTSAEVIREGLRNIGSQNKFVSSFFVMKKDEDVLYFADCAVNPNPDAEQLSKIAAQTCENVIRLGDVPSVAFLSYSTEGSAKGEHVEKVQDAKFMFEKSHPGLDVYGDIQFDAAWDPSVYKMKTNKEMVDPPNVFVFPDLNSGNIAYKITQRLAGYTAIGPLLQGFDRPLYDLSRGVDATALKEICKIVNRLIDGR